MRCPECGAERVRTIDSHGADAEAPKRIRQCRECGARFVTVETLDHMLWGRVPNYGLAREHQKNV